MAIAIELDNEPHEYLYDRIVREYLRITMGDGHKCVHVLLDTLLVCCSQMFSLVETFF